MAGPFLQSSEELLEKLEIDGLQSGMTIWLKKPLRELNKLTTIPGLSKFTYRDAVIGVDRYRDRENDVAIIINVQDDAENIFQIIINNSNYYSTGEYGTALGKIFIKNPKNITSKWSKRVIEAIKSKEIVMGMTADQIRTSWGIL